MGTKADVLGSSETRGSHWQWGVGGWPDTDGRQKDERKLGCRQPGKSTGMHVRW